MPMPQAGGPELRGSNITLAKVMAKTDVSLRQTKIICTMGPSCWDVPKLEELIDAGMSVARFNFSHGDHEGHKACLDRVRTAAKNKGKHVGESIRLRLLHWIVCSIKSRVRTIHSGRFDVGSCVVFLPNPKWYLSCQLPIPVTNFCQLVFLFCSASVASNHTICRPTHVMFEHQN